MGLLRCYNRRRNNSVRDKNVVINLAVGVVLACVGVLVSSVQVQGLLSLTKKCGDDGVCQALEYCRQHDHVCQPCRDVCDASSANKFDEDRCVADCQDYIHDERYLNLQNSSLMTLQRTELEEKYKDLEGDVFILKLIVGICVVVIILVVGCLLAFFAYFWKLMHPPQPGTPDKKKSAANKAASVELPTVYNNRYGVTTPTPETSPSSVTSSSPADTNITTLSSTTTVPPYSAHTPTPPALAARSSPSKSESSVATPGTATTILMSSAASTLVNGGRSGMSSFPTTNRYRREPSESTLPDNCAYDNLSMSPQHIHYSHHV